MYDIQFSHDASDDIEYFKKPVQRRIYEEIVRQLTHQPATETRNRKPMRPNPLAAWELRVESYRIFYKILEDEQIVDIVAIGWKEHNRLYIRGKEVIL